MQVTDNSDYFGDATCSPKNIYFSIGELEINCTAIDRSGNIGKCSFQVIVRQGMFYFENGQRDLFTR